MRVRRTPAVALSLAVLGGFAVVAFSAPPGALPTTTSKMAEKAVNRAYKVVDVDGRKIGTANWRVTRAGGNCCEVLVMATRTGRLVEFGGTYPIYSDDEGKTWNEINPTVPSTSRVPNPGPRKIAGGEGTLVQSPDGDILGVGWDPYSGDRLQSFMYHAKDKKWYYQEAPLHEPFYDREWVAVAKGPFTINGTKVPWVSMVVSNFNRRIVLMSTDGLNYFQPTQRQVDALAHAPVSKFLPTTPDPDLDYMQEHAQTKLSALAQGILSFDSVNGCKVQTLTPNGSWACFSLPNEQEITGPLHTDSRGWIHEVVAQKGETQFTYRMSRNGGRTWTQTIVPVPGELAVETFDFKMHGKLGLGVIATHAKKDDGAFQDIVIKLDIKGAKPKVGRMYYVGDGNLKSTVGLDVGGTVQGAKSNRVDFTSVAILPNGTIAVSFADARYDDPAVAVLPAR